MHSSRAFNGRFCCSASAWSPEVPAAGPSGSWAGATSRAAPAVSVLCSTQGIASSRAPALTWAPERPCSGVHAPSFCAAARGHETKPARKPPPSLPGSLCGRTCAPCRRTRADRPRSPPASGPPTRASPPPACSRAAPPRRGPARERRQKCSPRAFRRLFVAVGCRCRRRRALIRRHPIDASRGDSSMS